MRLTSKALGLFLWHSSQMLQIVLVADQHDDHLGITMLFELS